MAQESSKLFHLHLLISSCSKSERLELGGGENEGMKIPETDGMSHRRVTLSEKILKLIGFKVVGNGQITTISRPTALPSSIAKPLPLHNLNLRLNRGFIPTHKRRHYNQRQYHQKRVIQSHFHLSPLQTQREKRWISGWYNQNFNEKRMNFCSYLKWPQGLDRSEKGVCLKLANGKMGKWRRRRRRRRKKR